jgi:hypothetical protein
VYADDVVIMARSKRMEEFLKALNKNTNEVGLSINQENTVNTKISNINRSKKCKYQTA